MDHFTVRPRIGARRNPAHVPSQRRATPYSPAGLLAILLSTGLGIYVLQSLLKWLSIDQSWMQVGPVAHLSLHDGLSFMLVYCSVYLAMSIAVLSIKKLVLTNLG